VGLPIGLAVWAFDQYPTRILATSSLNYSTINFDEVNCLSIDPHKIHFDGREYSDPHRVVSIADILSVKDVLFDAEYTTCPWGSLGRSYPKLFMLFGMECGRHNIWFLPQFASELPTAASIQISA
jgi:hypothetical protein